MRRIKSKDSGPELTVRRLAHRLGYRYRLHDHKLPGRPDLTFPAKRKAVFVHGCFWHSHRHCKMAHIPQSRMEYWHPKLERNRERDRAHLRELKALGWKTLVIWECEAVVSDALAERLQRFLG